jgi:hypothetical protein
MQDAPISCPYCNALVPAANASPARRIDCPRCGDSFLVRENPTSSVPISDQLEIEVRRHRLARQTKAARSVRVTLIAGICLGGLGLLAGIGISYFRSEPTSPPPIPAEPSASVPPLEMAALAYLPATSDSVVAFQLRPLVKAPSGGEKGARQALVQLGVPSAFVDACERLAGVGLDNVDQIVVGLTLKEGLLAQQPVLIIHTRQEFSIDKLARIENARSESRGARTYHRFPVSAKIRFDIHCWAPNDRFLVAALQPDCLDAVPDDGFPADKQLTPRIRDLASSLLTADTVCWAVLDSDKWDSLGKFILSFDQKHDDQLEKAANSLGNLQTAVFGIRLENEPILTAWFDLKSEAAGADLRRLLLKRLQDEKGKIVTGGAGNRVMVRTAVAIASDAFERAVRDPARPR